MSAILPLVPYEIEIAELRAEIARLERIVAALRRALGAQL